MSYLAVGAAVVDGVGVRLRRAGAGFFAHLDEGLLVSFVTLVRYRKRDGVSVVVVGQCSIR